MTWKGRCRIEQIQLTTDNTQTIQSIKFYLQLSKLFRQFFSPFFFVSFLFGGAAHFVVIRRRDTQII